MSKPINFTPHALEKLDLIRRQGFAVDEETAIAAIRSPQENLLGYSGRFVAQTILDEAHVLRVIYEESDEITVVTLYPGRRGRYES